MSRGDGVCVECGGPLGSSLVGVCWQCLSQDKALLAGTIGWLHVCPPVSERQIGLPWFCSFAEEVPRGELT